MQRLDLKDFLNVFATTKTAIGFKVADKYLKLASDRRKHDELIMLNSKQIKKRV